MSDSEDWIYQILPQNQADDIKSRMERVYDDENIMFSLVLTAPRSAAITLCRMFDGASEGDIPSWIGIVQFIGAIVEMIEEELRKDGIDPYED